MIQYEGSGRGATRIRSLRVYDVRVLKLRRFGQVPAVAVCGVLEDGGLQLRLKSFFRRLSLGARPHEPVQLPQSPFWEATRPLGLL